MSEIERRSAVGGAIVRRGDRYIATFPRAGGKQRIRSQYDFSAHPLREFLREFILGDVEEVAAGTIRMRCIAAQNVGEFMHEAGFGDLTPQVFSALLGWLTHAVKSDGHPRFGEESVRRVSRCVLSLYQIGIGKPERSWTQRNLDVMRARHAHTMKGGRERRLQRSVEMAMSEQSFSDLACAVSLEFAACERVLAEYQAGERAYLQAPGRGIHCLDPNPFVVFALQAGMRVGLRAPELNALGSADIFRDPEHGNHEIYTHAPNKADDFIPVDDVFLRALDLCEAWKADAQRRVSETEQVWPDELLVYTSTSPVENGTPVVLQTMLLNAVHLPAFFEKYFRIHVEDAGGERPLLHAEEDQAKPFYVSYAKIRNAFAVRLSDRQSDPGVVQQMMRHKSFQTTETFYLHRRKLDHARKTAIALESEARMLVLGMRDPYGSGITEETLEAARQKGALVPLGLCGSALGGGTCISPGHCLECDRLVVLSSRRHRLEADRDAQVAKAAAAEERGDTRGAENSRSLAARAQAYIFQIEQRQHGRAR